MSIRARVCPHISVFLSAGLWGFLRPLQPPISFPHIPKYFSHFQLFSRHRLNMFRDDHLSHYYKNRGKRKTGLEHRPTEKRCCKQPRSIVPSENCRIYSKHVTPVVLFVYVRLACIKLIFSFCNHRDLTETYQTATFHQHNNPLMRNADGVLFAFQALFTVYSYSVQEQTTCVFWKSANRPANEASHFYFGGLANFNAQEKNPLGFQTHH